MCRRQETYKRDLEVGRPRRRKIWRAIMCPIDFGIVLNQENRERAEFRFKSRGNPKRNLYAGGEPGSFNGTFFVPVTSTVYFSAAQLYSHLHGDEVHVFRDVYVSRLSREAHIFILLLNEERKKERERDKSRSEEENAGMIRGESSMTEIDRTR